MKHVFEISFEIALPIGVVFDFFSAASNLEKITPPEMRFRLVTPEPIAMSAGTVIDYKMRIMRFPVKWQSLISRWEPPHAFVDEQTRGPYASWLHTHTFEETPGGTLIHDRVEYALPFAPFGEVAAFFVRWQLDSIFAYREWAIRHALLPGSVSGRIRR